jgi:hypothetical protein
MMNKPFWISVLVIFIVSWLFGFVIHGFLLGAEYATLTTLFRQPPEAQSYLVYIIVAHLIFAIGFVWIYRQGKEDKPFLMQGLRYGVAIAVLSTIPIYLIYYAVQPMPGAVVAQQIVYDTIAILILGVIVAWLNK